MKDNFKCFAISLICILSIGCNSNSEAAYSEYKETKILSNDETLIINIPDKITNASGIIDTTNLRFIPLETKDGSLIGNITDIKFDSNIIFVADLMKENRITIFTRDGKYLNTIARRGNGPQEYLNCSDFSIDSKNKIIYILDGDKGNILAYDYNGEFIDKIELPVKLLNHFILGDTGNIYIETGYRHTPLKNETLHNIMELERSSGKMLNVFFPYNSDLFRLYINRNKFSERKGNIYTWELLGKDVYRIEKDSLTTVYTLGEKNPACPRYFYGYHHPQYRKEVVTEKYCSIYDFLEFEDWIYAGIMEKNYVIHNFVNKHTKENYFDISYMRGVETRAVIFPQLFKVDDSTFCCWIEANAATKFKMVPADLRNSLYDDDNPVLIFYSLK